MPITLRNAKGFALTHAEMDGNFTDLDTRITTIESSSNSGISSVVDAGGDGSLNWNSTTKVLTYTGPNETEVRAHFSAGSGISITSGSIAVNFASFNTGNITEGTNLYYTNSRADARIAAASLSDLSDVHTASPTDGQVLTWDNGNSRWAPANTLSTLSVTQAAASGTGTLTYNNTTGVFVYTPPDLSTYLTSITSGDVTTALGFTPLASESNDLTATVTWANVPDTNITESSVTQHQAALSITESQISDLTHYTNSDFNTAFAAKDTDDLSEGSLNLYYTDARVNSALAASSIDDFSDVDTTSVAPSDGDALIWSAINSEWTPGAITAGSGTGESNDAVNVGTGAGIYKTKVGTDIHLKTLIVDADVFTTTSNIDDLTFTFAPSASLDLNSQKIVNLGTPTANTDAATKAYVDAVAGGGTSSLSIAGDTGTDSVDLALDTLAINGTLNEIETVITNNTITIGLPSSITANVTGDVTGNVTGDVTGNVTGDVTGNVTGDTAGTHTGAVVGNVTGDVTGTVSDISNHDTDALTEGLTNFYFSTARVDSHLSGGTGVTYNAGAISIGQAVGTGDTVTFAGVTAPLIGDVTGNLTGNVTGNVSGSSGSTTGNAATATALETARTIGGVSFDGTANISLPGVDAIGTQDTSGNAATATALETARTISLTGDATGSASFDGTGNISIATTVAASTPTLGTDTNGNYVATITGTANEIEVTGSGSETAAVTIGLPNDVTISGNLTVSGTTTTVNTETINLADNIILLNSNATGSPTQNAGIEIERGDDVNVQFVWNETSDKWSVGSSTFIAATFEGNLTGNVTGNVVGNLTGDVTGNVTGNVTSSGTSTFSTVDINGGNIDATVIGATSPGAITGTTITANTGFVGNLTGNVTGNASTATTAAAWTTGRTLSLIGDVTGSVTGVDGTGNISVTTTIGANSVDLTTHTTGNYVATGAVSGNGLSGSASAEGATFTVTSNATSANTPSTIVFRDASGNFSAGTITATATEAQYADLAEIYASDAEYEPGTVLKIGGDAEVTQTTSANDTQVIGVVSSNPAYLMNKDAQGVAVAMTGRVFVKVKGSVAKGQRLVSSDEPGVAVATRDTDISSVLAIIGRALESNPGEEIKLVECMVGKL